MLPQAMVVVFGGIMIMIKDTNPGLTKSVRCIPRCLLNIYIYYSNFIMVELNHTESPLYGPVVTTLAPTFKYIWRKSSIMESNTPCNCHERVPAFIWPIMESTAPQSWHGSRRQCKGDQVHNYIVQYVLSLLSLVLLDFQGLGWWSPFFSVPSFNVKKNPFVRSDGLLIKYSTARVATQF